MISGPGARRNRPGWQAATRDDAQVASALHRTRSVDRVHALNEAAFFDELFCYLREIGLMPLLEALDPGDRRGAIYPFLQFALFTIMRCVGGVQSMLATHDVLLTDEALMSTLGFNAVQVEQGSNKRGMGRCKKPVAIRGPFSFETVADNIVRIGPEKLMDMFNGAIRYFRGHRKTSKGLPGSDRSRWTGAFRMASFYRPSTPTGS